MKKKFLLVLAFVCLVVCIAGIALSIYMAANNNLVVDTGIKTEEQNYSIGYDADENLFFIGTRTGSLIAYDNDTHEVMWSRKISEAGHPITSVKVHADNGTLFAGSDDGNVYIMNLATGDVTNTIVIQARVRDLDATSDDSLVAAITQTNDKANLRIFDVATGEQIKNVKYTYHQKGVLFTSDDQELILVNKRGEIMRVDFRSSDDKETVKVLTKVNDAVNSEIYCLKSAVDGEYMVADLNGNIAIFDEDINILRTGSIKMIEGSRVSSGGVDASGNICVGTEQGWVYVINADNELIYQFQQRDKQPISDFATDGNVMYITGYADFVDSIELSRLETIAMLQSLATLITALTIAFGVLTLFFVGMYFPRSHRLMVSFVQALWKYRLAYILLIPTFTLLALFNYTPVFMALTRAFTNWSVRDYRSADLVFVGLDQFKSALKDTHFLYGVRNLLILMVTGFVKLLTMPIIAAYLVYSFKSDKQKYIFRFLFVLPIVVPGVVGSLMWKEIYNTGGGLDQLLKAIGKPEWIHVWLGEEGTALWSIIFMGIPYIGAMPFLLYYGGLTAIDSSLYEAARIDGAGRWKIFWRVQLPMIMPQVKLLVMLQFIGSIQDYGGILLMTGGGPGRSTFTPGLALYYDATANGQYGRACAMGIMMFIVIMIGTYFNNKIKAENYGS